MVKFPTSNPFVVCFSVGEIFLNPKQITVLETGLKFDPLIVEDHSFRVESVKDCKIVPISAQLMPDGKLVILVTVLGDDPVKLCAEQDIALVWIIDLQASIIRFATQTGEGRIRLGDPKPIENLGNNKQP